MEALSVVDVINQPTPLMRGGKRKGAGRPTINHTGPARVCRVTLDDATVTAMQSLGDGNLSKGIRKAADLLGPTVDKQP